MGYEEGNHNKRPLVTLRPPWIKTSPILVETNLDAVIL